MYSIQVYTHVRRSHIRTLLPAAEYRTDPVELRATSLMTVSPGGQATCLRAPSHATGPSCVSPDDLYIEIYYIGNDSFSQGHTT